MKQDYFFHQRVNVLRCSQDASATKTTQWKHIDGFVVSLEQNMLVFHGQALSVRAAQGRFVLVGPRG